MLIFLLILTFAILVGVQIYLMLTFQDDDIPEHEHHGSDKNDETVGFTLAANKGGYNESTQIRK